MGWLDALIGRRSIVVPGPEITLRTPMEADYEAWSELRRVSREFLAPFEPLWPEDDLEPAAFRRRLTRYREDLGAQTGYPFFVTRTGDGALLGGIGLSNVRRGVVQACSMGYWVGAPFARHGITTKAVRQLQTFVFETLALHRIEAACLPHNTASTRVLEKAGFTREGYARRYLCIAGSWQDHLLFGLTVEDWQADRRKSPSEGGEHGPSGRF